MSGLLTAIEEALAASGVTLHIGPEDGKLYEG